MRKCRLFKAIVVLGCSLGAAAGCDVPEDGAAGSGAGAATPSYGVGHPGSLARADGASHDEADTGADPHGEEPHTDEDAGATDAGGPGAGTADSGGDAAQAGDTGTVTREDAGRPADGMDHGDLGDSEDGWHTTK